MQRKETVKIRTRGFLPTYTVPQGGPLALVSRVIDLHGTVGAARRAARKMVLSLDIS